MDNKYHTRCGVFLQPSASSILNCSKMDTTSLLVEAVLQRLLKEIGKLPMVGPGGDSRVKQPTQKGPRTQAGADKLQPINVDGLPDLAVAVRPGSFVKSAVMYKPRELADSINSFIDAILAARGRGDDIVSPTSYNLAKGLKAGCVVAKIDIYKSQRGTCADAYEVKLSAGPGYGQKIYGIAMAMAPSGRLMPDRTSISDKAIDRWKKISDEAGAARRGSIRLDDRGHPKTPEHDAVHTEDPSDDCKVFNAKGLEFLDYAYEMTGEEGDMLAKYVSAHESTMDRVLPQAKHMGLDRDDIDYVLSEAGSKLFGDVYTGKSSKI